MARDINSANSGHQHKPPSGSCSAHGAHCWAHRSAPLGTKALISLALAKVAFSQMGPLCICFLSQLPIYPVMNSHAHCPCLHRGAVPFIGYAVQGLCCWWLCMCMLAQVWCWVVVCVCGFLVVGCVGGCGLCVVVVMLVCACLCRVAGCFCFMCG